MANHFPSAFLWCFFKKLFLFQSFSQYLLSSKCGAVDVSDETRTNKRQFEEMVLDLWWLPSIWFLYSTLLFSLGLKNICRNLDSFKILLNETVRLLFSSLSQKTKICLHSEYSKNAIKTLKRGLFVKYYLMFTSYKFYLESKYKIQIILYVLFICLYIQH